MEVNTNIRGANERAGSIDETLLAQAIAIENQNIQTGNPGADDFNRALTQLQDILLKASTIQASVATLNIGDEYRMYYDRIVRPAVDILYFLSFAVQNTASAANLYQSNNYGKRGEGKKALDISYDLLDQMEIALELIRESLPCLLEKGRCL
ncbi:hypothetical protein QYB59_000860 [Clostridium perfringens]|nr:hypothetical protein [Clostridium perfringens]